MKRPTELHQSFKRGIPASLWRDMIDMRNHLVHVYTDIDFNVLWQTAVEDLPPLISQLEAILGTED